MKKTLEQRFWEKVQVSTPDKCWEWTARKIKCGYGSMRWPGKDNADAQKLGHRASWEIHNGPIPEGMLVCHKCDNRGCVNPHHLFLGSPSDNVQDCIKKGRHRTATGEKQWASKLSRNDALRIRHCGWSAAEIAMKYGISRASAALVKSGKHWKKSDGTLMRMMDEVVGWIHPILPDRNPFDTTIKLASELSELQHALHTGDGSVNEEVADCLIVLLDLCFLLDVDLDKEVGKKMAINKDRDWTKVLGTLKHK